MKTDELDNQDDLDDYKPAEKKGKRTKAETSKISKTSNTTRRRHQPDSSEENMLPEHIPQSTGSDIIVTEGFENEFTKVALAVPFSQMQE